MAEGGSSHEVSDTSRPEFDSYLLDCPICLEQLHQPKSLPCLHSFCQECLSTFITKDLSGNMASATAFPCPVCRKMTHPVNAAENKDKWAQQFPTNKLVKDQVKDVTARELTFCKPCEKKGNTKTPATIWCKTCNVLFCDTCKLEYHDLIHEGCETVDVTGKGGMVQRQVTKQVRCEKHTEKMDYYCEDHQILGCSRCITIDHRRCEVVTTTQEYCDKLKKESRLDDLKTSLKKTTEAIELLIKEFGEQLQTLLEDQDTGLKSLADLRQRIDTRLDAMQKNSTDELIATYKEEKDNLEMSMQKCERLMFSIQNTIESSGTAIQKNDTVDTILLFQRGQAEVKSYEDLITEMRKKFTTVRIKHSVDPNLLTLDKDIPLSMGKIKIEKNLNSLSGPKSPLSKCGVTEVSKFCIKCPSDVLNCHAPGVVYLPDDHIVVGDYNNKKIKLFTVSGKCEDVMKVSGKPHDMCLLDDNTVAVANYDASVIYVIKVESSKLSLMSEIKLSQNITPWGITTTGDGFTVSSKGDLYNVQQNGNTQHIQTCSSQCYHLVSDPRTRHLYGSQPTSTSGRVAVFRLSDGTRTDMATVGVLKEAFGVDVDGEGNVYVCGRESNNVVQMSEEGAHVRELLTSSDGVVSPRAMSVCGNKFVVTNQSIGNQNNVHVFQLS
ncbi:E3 ubiquitin-protein ligase TRIM9-like [Mizuhopecten yessoensis]|uniref:E3 ubiquitin-protein ligase TRIM9-like n=1 Tax=Mizuhopecten yessoensis TaxID=6573 RepID=UPI000B4582C9|nr:E3 ubiquitin-protein ligase TRIM9-like [Mizuhopecten yessoensis]